MCVCVPLIWNGNSDQGDPLLFFPNLKSIRAAAALCALHWLHFHVSISSRFFFFFPFFASDHNSNGWKEKERRRRRKKINRVTARIEDFINPGNGAAEWISKRSRWLSRPFLTSSNHGNKREREKKNSFFFSFWAAVFLWQLRTSWWVRANLITRNRLTLSYGAHYRNAIGLCLWSRRIKTFLAWYRFAIIIRKKRDSRDTSGNKTGRCRLFLFFFVYDGNNVSQVAPVNMFFFFFFAVHTKQKKKETACNYRHWLSPVKLLTAAAAAATSIFTIEKKMDKILLA